MIFIYIVVLAGGALPLILFLIKRKKYNHILHNGVKTMGEISSIRTVRYTRGPAIDHVTYIYLPGIAKQYLSGMFTARRGKYRRGDKLEIMYLADKPEQNIKPGATGQFWAFLFVLAIFVFAVFACYKIYEMAGDQEIHFNPL